MDRGAFAVAQAAIGNSPEAALIEVSLGGLVLDCLQGEVSFALAGGAFAAQVAGVRLAPWTVAGLRAGQRLTIRAGDWGSWACIALAGDLVVPRWLGSAATGIAASSGSGLPPDVATICKVPAVSSWSIDTITGVSSTLHSSSSWVLTLLK